MCGIFGVFSSNQALLDRTSNRLSLHLLDHRGPDDSGVYQDEDIFLGHTRLRILDSNFSIGLIGMRLILWKMNIGK
jgi:asparagine synthase (glutamine-hydrolysing)